MKEFLSWLISLCLALFLVFFICLFFLKKNKSEELSENTLFKIDFYRDLEVNSSFMQKDKSLEDKDIDDDQDLNISDFTLKRDFDSFLHKDGVFVKEPDFFKERDKRHLLLKEEEKFAPPQYLFSFTEFLPKKSIALKKAPVILHKVLPVFPVKALKQGISEGFVRLLIEVDNKGEVKNLRVLSAEPPAYFETESLKAVKKWLFAPMEGEDEDTLYYFELPLHFKKDF